MYGLVFRATIKFLLTFHDSYYIIYYQNSQFLSDFSQLLTKYFGAEPQSL